MKTQKFLKLGLLFLLSTLVFGLLAGLQYVVPGIGRDVFSFEKLRPLHVSSAVFWILTAAMGGVMTFLSEERKTDLQTHVLVKAQYFIFLLSFVAILLSYCFGVFGGREYWEFHPYFSVLIVLGWLLFIVNYFRNVKSIKNQPVYVWMWSTGLIFFLFTYLESNFWWVIPKLNNNLIHDMTVQWKSYGSLVGSWNLLIYGSSIYLMDKISGNKKYSHSNIAFMLYGLGLFNLMFNWGHHIYTLPTASHIKHIAYLVSMTELFILGRIIYTWGKSLTEAKKIKHIFPARLLFAADAWVFANLGLAILMSIPVFNVFMHGTHVIVGHTMGTTIGINTMLLLAYAYEVFKPKLENKKFQFAYALTNTALVVFFLSLIFAGFSKSYIQYHNPQIAYTDLIEKIRPFFYVFYVAGATLTVGFIMLIYPLLVVKKN